MSNPFVLGNHKFHTLDALRGVAALAVVAYHSNTLSAHTFRHGYLAVDFFFVLSGFVLSYAYGDKLAAGWSTLSFIRARFIRLWPLNLLGLIFGLAVVSATHELHLGIAATLWAFLLNLVFLPAHLRLAPPVYPYVFNPVAWTLFFELFSNVFHVLFLRRASTFTLLLLAAVTGFVLAVQILHAGSADIGMDFVSITGYVRVLFSYIVGMLLFRLWRSRRVSPRLSPALMVAVLTLCLAMDVPKRFAAFYDLASIMLIFPLIVILSAFAVTSLPYGRVLQSLGAASYAIYVLHAPALHLMQVASAHLLHRPLESLRPLSGLILLPSIMALALLADRYFDIPVRRYLGARPRRALPPLQAEAAQHETGENLR